MRLRAVSVAILLPAMVLLFAALRAEVPKRSPEPALIYTSTTRYDVIAWLQGRERFPQGAALMLRQGGVSHALAPEFAATADANVSFDGAKLLFSGKKAPGDHWQIWEIAFAGGGARQVTSCDDDCVAPFYLPEERFAYAHKIDGVFGIEAASLAGRQPLRLTYTPGNALPTDVLHDGRILFETSFPLGQGSVSEIFTVYPDGSGVESYRCDHGADRHSARQTTSGDIVFAGEHGLGRFTSALANGIQVKTPGGEFAGDAIEAGSGALVLSWRPDSRRHYSLRRWNGASTVPLLLIAADANADLVQPVIVGPRAVPNRFPSALHDWSGANVLCLNAYTSKLPIASGTVDSIQVYTLVQGTRVLLGRAHVEKDGSFFLHVPGDQPLQLELLDSSGNTVQREHGWFWMRNGEQRVCVGCHAGPERAPENAIPEVLVKSTNPADMTQQISAQKGGR